MPVYEYRCEQCTHQFEATQSIHARPEDTACPQCKGIGATRVLSAFASQVKGTHKTGFKEMQAYNMLQLRLMACFIRRGGSAEAWCAHYAPRFRERFGWMLEDSAEG